VNKTNRTKHLPTFALMLVAMIWGAGFMAVQIALDNGFSEGLMLFGRFAVAALVLLIVAGKRLFPASRQELLYGLIAGFLLFLGFYVQTAGLRFTTPSNNGFFTATNVMMVPFIAWFLHKKRPPIKLFFCCLMALAGFFILAWNPDIGFSVNLGDLLTLLCAFFFACHIASLGIFSPKVDALRLSFFQIAFAGGFSLIAFLLFELPALSLANWKGGLPAVIFMGLFPTCLCFLIQTWAQGKTSSGKTAVILSCESLWCMIFSVMLGYEQLSVQMVVGGLVIVSAVCLLEVELPFPARRKKETSKEEQETPKEQVVA
jgi:drug/metabolite transporter (DMT)-like permease